LVHTMHTMARVKNAQLAEGDAPEPPGREIGEAQVVDAADRLVANTVGESGELVDLYGADPGKVRVVSPGVDLEQFTVGDVAAARGRLGLPRDAYVLLFVGRIQPLKAPDVLLKATADLLARRPDLRHRLVVAVVGGPSGSGLGKPRALQELAHQLDIAAQVRLVPPVDRATLALWYRAAGLESLLDDPARRELLSRRAVEHASQFSWERTTDRLLEVYTESLLARANSLRDDTLWPIEDAAELRGVPAAVIP
jgi:D-inositol-3-phosphate glycosyltransferase